MNLPVFERYISFFQVKPIMMKSKLNVDILGKLWDLADADKDGHLDREEFHIVSH